MAVSRITQVETAADVSAEITPDQAAVLSALVPVGATVSLALLVNGQVVESTPEWTATARTGKNALARGILLVTDAAECARLAAVTGEVVDG